MNLYFEGFRLGTRLELYPYQHTTIRSVACLQHVDRLFQSEFSTVCDIMLPLSIYWRSSGSCLCLRRLPLISVFFLSFFSLACLRRQFLRKMWWPIQLAFLLFIVCRIFQPLTLVTLLRFSHDRSYYLLHPSPVRHFKTIASFLVPFSSSFISRSPFIAI